jgi:multidrug resistance protein, MATE family
MGPVDIATHNCLLTLFELMSTVLYGMGEALSVRVGYHLGYKNVKGAKLACAVAFSLATAWSLLLSLVLIGAHSDVGRIFSDDPAVIALASKVCGMCVPFPPRP